MALLSRLRQLFQGKPSQVASRSPRVSIHSLGWIRFQITGSGAAVHALANLSTSGLGLLRDSEKSTPAAGSILEGVLMFQDRELPVAVRVVHVSQKIIGCAFRGDVDALSSLGKEISKSFATEFSALELKEVRRDVLKEDPDGEPRLFRGRDDCELYYVVQDGRLRRFEIVFFGNHIEGGPGMPLRYGLMDESSKSADEKAKHAESVIVRPQGPVPKQMIAVAAGFIANIPGLEETPRRSILSVLEEPSALS